MKNCRLIVWLIYLLSWATSAQITITATATPSNCLNTGSITLVVEGAEEQTLIYGIVKDPYPGNILISSTSTEFSGLEPGTYFYGYFDGPNFVSSPDSIVIENLYSAVSPSFSDSKTKHYSYCGTTDPLGTVIYSLQGGNPPFVVSLLNAQNVVVQEKRNVRPNMVYSFENVAAGTYKLKAEDACHTVVFDTESLLLQPNVPYTGFVLSPPNLITGRAFINVEYNGPDGFCTGIKKANIFSIWGLFNSRASKPIDNVDTNIGPYFYGRYEYTYKVEIQNELGGFDVYDNLRRSDLSGGTYFRLPNDRLKWGLVKLTAELCNFTETIMIDLSTYPIYRPVPMGEKQIIISDETFGTSCDEGRRVVATFDANQAQHVVGGCYPFVMQVTDIQTNSTQIDTITSAQRFSSVLLVRGKRYRFKITDANGVEATRYSCWNKASASGDYSIKYFNPLDFYVDPIRFKLKKSEISCGSQRDPVREFGENQPW